MIRRPNEIRAHCIDAATLDGKTVPEREWCIPGLNPAGNVTLLHGDGGAGKSLLAKMRAACLATGTHFFGRQVGHAVRVGRDSWSALRLDRVARRLVETVALSTISHAAAGFDGLHASTQAPRPDASCRWVPVDRTLPMGRIDPVLPAPFPEMRIFASLAGRPWMREYSRRSGSHLEESQGYLALRGQYAP
jgi:hypothetical protein